MSKIASDEGYNPFTDIDALPFTDDQKEMVLEWFAQVLWQGLDEPGHCKSYDPLVIEGNTAHSYVMNLDDGGRHHSFESLHDLEQKMIDEMRKMAKFYVRELKENDPI